MAQYSEQEVQKGRRHDVASQLHVFSEAHIRSFNFFLEDGPELICKYLNPLEVFASQVRAQLKLPETAAVPFESMKIWFESLTIGMPSKFQNIARSDQRVFPWEARISGGSYCAPLVGNLCRVGGG